MNFRTSLNRSHDGSLISNETESSAREGGCTAEPIARAVASCPDKVVTRWKTAETPPYRTGEPFQLLNFVQTSSTLRGSEISRDCLSIETSRARFIARRPRIHSWHYGDEAFSMYSVQPGNFLRGRSKHRQAAAIQPDFRSRSAEAAQNYSAIRAGREGNQELDDSTAVS